MPFHVTDEQDMNPRQYPSPAVGLLFHLLTPDQVYV